MDIHSSSCKFNLTKGVLMKMCIIYTINHLDLIITCISLSYVKIYFKNVIFLVDIKYKVKVKIFIISQM